MNSFDGTRVILPLVIAAAMLAPAAAFAVPSDLTAYHPNPGSHVTPAPDAVRGHWFYPDQSRQMREEGIVGLKISLTGQGTMREATIEKSSGFRRLDEAALDYARQSYQYRVDEGEQMPEIARITVKFDLD